MIEMPRRALNDVPFGFPFSKRVHEVWMKLDIVVATVPQSWTTSGPRVIE